MKITTPPSEKEQRKLLHEFLKKSPHKIEQYLELNSPVDSKGRYLSFDELQYRVDKSVNAKLAWQFVKRARQNQLKPVIALGSPPIECEFFLTHIIQKACSEVDRHTTNAALELMCSKIGEQKNFEYLINDLIEDEAIGSSQLEGAATTTRVAKTLLKRQRKPRTPDEKMILGNFNMMHFAWEHRDELLSLDLIKELHIAGVKGIQDNKYYPGRIRDTDDVEIVDEIGNVIYTPPSSQGLKERLEKLSNWANIQHHEVDSSNYLHPLIKAITLHFAIGYEHPFYDGNGRVARSLFYWYMFKNRFAAFRYITISSLLKKAPAQYAKSYLYTETDNMDLTYFLNYQCDIITRAIKRFRTTYEKNLKNMEDFNQWLWESGLYEQLNHRQRIILQVAKNGVVSYFTTNEVKNNLSCSYNTAANILNKLVDLKLFRKEKKGREWVFSMLDKKEIIRDWEIN
ncbi:Fic family protein [Picosynechococcus sp. PCC 11901]|uniref:Fic family protein n=1 Tax=unclassified Picosynechococcus TaxID=3079910 RepID=UPI0008108533|nr:MULTISPECIES: Fic family protein [unclassified Picosynechococcus]ANV86898.1 cell filamentation protein Fic [Picosynechococcus sp. PCC 7117]QCS49638.1 Fic family protein [Picosynechococcus sp. PCC 11901]